MQVTTMLLVLGAVGLLVPGCASAYDPPPTGSVNSDATVEAFLDRWADAWRIESGSRPFDADRLAPLYEREGLLAFDATDSVATGTVIRGWDSYVATWVPWMRQWRVWSFQPDRGTVTVHGRTDTFMAVSTLVDLGGTRHDGTTLAARAHATLLLVQRDGRWRIKHESIWGPVRENGS